jgi:hypothetical protein
MPKATQLNLELQNKPGILAGLCRDLAARGVNLLALSAPDTTAKQAPVRLLVVNPDLAKHMVKEAGYTFSIEDVLYIEIKNRPGSLAKAMEKLAGANINVKYTYATASTAARKTAVVIGLAQEDLPKALKLLG